MEKQINSNPFENIGEEEKGREGQEKNDRATFGAWQEALSFITLEVLGEKVFNHFLTHKPDFAEVGPNETRITTKITDWEKYLFRLADSVAVYIRKNGCFFALSTGRGIQVYRKGSWDAILGSP